MGGLIYNSTNQGVYSIDVMNLDQFPDHLSPYGENPNLMLRSVLTTDQGECLPMYEFIGSDESWGDALLSAESAPKNEGNVLKFVQENNKNGMVALSVGELNISNTGDVAIAPTDYSFAGVSYEEVFSALQEAGFNKRNNIEPTNSCDIVAGLQKKGQAYVM